MKFQIEIKSDIIQRAFSKAFSLDTNIHVDFFHDLRQAFGEEIGDLLINKGIPVNKKNYIGSTYLRSAEKVIEVDPIISKYKEELGIEFCSGYGSDDYSLSAINYSYDEYCKLPSMLPFFKVKEFSIGNIAVQIENGDYDININTSDNIKIVGYSFHASSRKTKPYLCIYGIRFKYKALKPIFKKYYNDCNCKDLDEILIEVIYYPIIFICRKCGQLFTCKCFDNYFDIYEDIVRLVRYSEVKNHLERIKIRDNICHLCTDNVSKLQCGGYLPSLFLQRYFPYYELFSRKKYGQNVFLEGEAAKEVENELRKRVGYPKIGEKWQSETTLFKVVQTFFSNKEVIYHYRGKELNGLEIDIWVPDLKLAIEYQGEQHFQTIKHWGGEKGLRERIERDKKKRMLCKKVGYDLIEFKYNEDITIKNVEKKLKRYLKK